MENIKKQNYTNKISIILFLLVPFFYFTGPFLSDLTIIVIILLFLFNFQKLETLKIAISPRENIIFYKIRIFKKNSTQVLS